MMNVNIINGLVKGISEQIPLVNSFYTQSPYEVWNTKEIQYGSVSFVITKVNTTDTVTTYEAVLYYADRLMEDGLNRDAIHSDSATVIQTIVGAMNQSDEWIKIDYPVGITLFEQDFSDTLSGGYATITIEVEGMGECFDGEFDIPEIVGTSAYFTKDEISELFPLRTELSTVAYTGSYNDLTDVPNLVDRQSFDQTNERLRVLTEVVDGKSDNTQLTQFVEGQNLINVKLAEEIRNKVDSEYVNGKIDDLSVIVDDKIGRQTFDTVLGRIDGEISGVEKSLENKVDRQSFDTVIQTIEGEIDSIPNSEAFNLMKTRMDSLDEKLKSKADKSPLNQFVNGQDVINTNLALQLEKKVDDDYLDGQLNGLKIEIGLKVDKRSFENTISNIYTKKETDKVVNERVESVVTAYMDSDRFIEDIKTAVGKDIGTVVDDYIISEEFAGVLSEVVIKEVEDRIGEFVTEDELDSSVADHFREYVKTNEFSNKVESIVTSKLNEFYTKTQSDNKFLTKTDATKNHYTKSEVDRKIEEATFVGVDLSDYYKKGETYSRSEIDGKVGASYTKSESDNKFLTKTDATKNHYTKSEVDELIENVEVDVDMTDIYTKSEVDSHLVTIYGRVNGLESQIADGVLKDVDLVGYLKTEDAENIYTKKSDTYTKSEVNELIDGISAGDIELTDYYRKSETYSRSEVDELIENVDVDIDMSNIYTKSEVYNKTEIDNTIGNIDSILNYVLYTI